MKKLNLFALCFLALLFGACSGDDPTAAPDIDEKLYEVNLSFAMTVESNSLSATRASRPLDPDDKDQCLQRVTDVRIYVFRSETGAEGSFVYYHPAVEDGTDGSVTRQPYFRVDEFRKSDEAPNWGDHNSNQEEHVYTVSPRLGKGYYRFLAVGRDDDPASTPLAINWVAGKTSWEKALMQNTGKTPVVTEIFSGYPVKNGGKEVETVELPGEERFVTSITMRRAVAGVLMYITNIPERLISDFGWEQDDEIGTGIIPTDFKKGDEYSVTGVAIVSVGHNRALNLMNRRWGNEDTDFEFDDSRFKLTRLAWEETKGHKKEACEGGIGDHTPHYMYTDIFKDGNFVFPARLTGRVHAPASLKDYPKSDDPFTALYPFQKSLYLCIYTESMSGGFFPLKMIPIKIARSNMHDPAAHENCAGDDVLDPTGTHFNLVANHLYTLGTPDHPIDLDDELKHPELEITVIGAWQVDVNIDMNF